MEKTGKDQGRVLSENVKAARAKHGMNQLELAESAGVSIGAIRQIETCVRWPRPKTLNAIATALKTTSMELLREDKKEGSLAVSDHGMDSIIELLSLWAKASDSTKEHLLVLLRSEDSEQSKARHRS